MGTDLTALSPAQFGERYGIGIHTTLALIARGKLRAVNVGLGDRPRWRITREAVAEFESRRGANAKPAAKRRKARRDETVTDYY